MTKRKSRLLLLLITAVYLVLFLFIRYNPLYDDEPGNYDQLKLFVAGKIEYYKGYSQYPGYPALLAFFGKVFQRADIPYFRDVNFSFSLFGIVIFYLLAKKIDYQSSIIKTIQYSFLPIIFPYRFLLYSENLSDPLVLASIWATLSNRYLLSAVLGILAVSVRQQNIVWLLFSFTLHYFIKYQSVNKTNFLEHLKKSWLFILGFIIFITVVIINGGIAMGNLKPYHPDFTIQMGNVWWMLWLIFLLFLPVHAINFRNVLLLVSSNRKILFFALTFTLTGFITFANLHPWNQTPDHLRNRILITVAKQPPVKLLFFLSVSFTVLSLYKSKFLSSKFYLLYPFALLSLLPIWLIESRYAFIPLTLFILFRRTTSISAELITISLFLLFSAFLYFGYLHQIFYL